MLNKYRTWSSYYAALFSLLPLSSESSLCFRVNLLVIFFRNGKREKEENIQYVAYGSCLSRKKGIFIIILLNSCLVVEKKRNNTLVFFSRVLYSSPFELFSSSDSGVRTEQREE